MKLVKRILTLASNHIGTMLFAVFGIIGASVLNLVAPALLRRFTASIQDVGTLTKKALFIYAGALVAAAASGRTTASCVSVSVERTTVIAASDNVPVTVPTGCCPSPYSAFSRSHDTGAKASASNRETLRRIFFIFVISMRPSAGRPSFFGLNTTFNLCTKIAGSIIYRKKFQRTPRFSS